MKYIAKKPATPSTTRSGTARLASLTGISAFGCTRRFSSATPWRKTISQRMTFMPPLVEPAQAQTNVISIMNVGMRPGPVGETGGQESRAGLHRNDLQAGVTQRGRERVELAGQPQVERRAADHDGDEPEVGMELGVAPVQPQVAAARDDEVQHEAGAAEEHEHACDGVDRGAVEVREARVVGREAGGR